MNDRVTPALIDQWRTLADVHGEAALDAQALDTKDGDVEFSLEAAEAWHYALLVMEASDEH